MTRTRMTEVGGHQIAIERQFVRGGDPREGVDEFRRRARVVAKQLRPRKDIFWHLVGGVHVEVVPDRSMLSLRARGLLSPDRTDSTFPTETISNAEHIRNVYSAIKQPLKDT